MPNEGSVAPKERVNIVYMTDTGGMQAEKELPFKQLIIGDFTQRPDATPLDQRLAINLTKDNFSDVMASHKLRLDLQVSNELVTTGEQMSVSLKITSLADFAPEAIARQVPALAKMIELRQALNALKGPLGNLPAFRKKILAIIHDEPSRLAILDELDACKP